MRQSIGLLTRAALCAAALLLASTASATTATVLTRCSSPNATKICFNGTPTQPWGVRMANAIWDHPDDSSDDPNRVIDELIAALPYYKAHGINMISFGLQGGRTGATSGDCVDKQYNSFNSDGTLKSAAVTKIKRLLDALDSHGMAANVILFYEGTAASADLHLADQTAYDTAIAAVATLLIGEGYRNVMVDIANECSISSGYPSGVDGRCSTLCDQWDVTDTSDLIPCGVSNGQFDEVEFKHNAVCTGRCVNDNSTCSSDGDCPGSTCGPRTGSDKPCVMNEMNRSDDYDEGSGGRGRFTTSELNGFVGSYYSNPSNAVGGEVAAAAATGTGWFVHSTHFQMVGIDDGGDCTSVGPNANGDKVGPIWNFGGPGLAPSSCTGAGAPLACCSGSGAGATCPGVHVFFDAIAKKAGITTAEQSFAVSWDTGADVTGCGQAANAPCKTPSYILAQRTLGAGDAVYLAPGTYRYGSGFEQTGSDSGTTGNPMTWKCAGGGDCLITNLKTTDDAAFTKTSGRNYVWETSLNSGANSGLNSPVIRAVFETVWNPAGILVDDRDPSEGLSNAVFKLTKPMIYYPWASGNVADVDSLPGSWLISGSTLYVHTYWSAAPNATTNNVEVTSDAAHGESIVFLGDTAHDIVFDGLDFAYTRHSLFKVDGADRITLLNSKGHSAKNIGYWFKSSGTTGLVVRNVEVSHIYGRQEFTRKFKSGTCADCGSCLGDVSNQCGWHNFAAGDGLKSDDVDGALFENVTATDCWENFSTENSIGNVYRNIFAKNSPNHTFTLVGAAECRDNLIERSWAFNAQDGFFGRGCQNTTIRRSYGRPKFDPGLDGSAGGVVEGTMVHSMSGSPASAQYNWSPAKKCSIGTGNGNANNACTVNDDCDGDPSTPGEGTCATYTCSDCGANSTQGALNTVNGYQIPIPGGDYGLTHPEGGYNRNRGDFAQLTGSAAIDAGDPDIDNDGIVERPLCNGGTRAGLACDIANSATDCVGGSCTATHPTLHGGNTYACPGSQDCCTLANYCTGRQPDIGPCEKNIDCETNGGGSAVAPAVCGNGVLDAGEQCDDGNTLNTDACTNACLTAVCGDGFVKTTATAEACDPGANLPNDCCTVGCALITSGSCDDGLFCQENTTCNGSGVCSGGNATSCDDANGTTTDVCNEATDVCDHNSTGGCNPPGSNACTDGEDDDGDGYCDFDGWCCADSSTHAANPLKVDIGCSSSSDTTESRFGYDAPGDTTWDIPCGDVALHQMLPDICSTASPTLLTATITAKTTCAPNTIVTVDTTRYSGNPRQLGAAGANVCTNKTIDFQGDDGVWWEPSVKWKDSSDCDNGSGGFTACTRPGETFPSGCPGRNEADQRFLILRGDSNFVRNVNLRWWGDGFNFDGNTSSSANDNVIEDYQCEFPGDDCVTFEQDAGQDAYRNTVRESTPGNGRLVFRYACDKALMAQGNDSALAPGDWNAKVQGLRCENCNGCLRGNTGANGYHIFERVTAITENPPDDQFACDYFGRFDLNAGTFNVSDSTASGCYDVFHLDDNAEVFIDGFESIGTVSKNIRVDASGGTGGATVVVAQGFIFGGGIGLDVESGWDATGVIDLGGGGGFTFPILGAQTSAGGNDFSGCIDPDGAGASVSGIYNRDGAYTIKAELACWKDADPSNEVSGLADYTPIASSCGAAAAGTGTLIRGASVRGGTIR